MSKQDHKLSTWQLMLMSTGGMIGAGWLFSPYYGFEMAGTGVMLSWAIIALLTLIIGIAFAEVITLLPLVGGLSRFAGVTHNRTISFIFLTLGWLSYVVYLPLEAQSAIQYLSFWYSDLVVQKQTGTVLSNSGLVLALAIMVLLTWFNTFFLKNVARVNSAVSIWKIFVPIIIAWFLIVMFGSTENVEYANNSRAFSFEKVLLAITGTGMAFAFTGFQNGLILANSVKDPKKALPYSLFAPIAIGFILYSSLSLLYIACLGDKQIAFGSAAPLLGLVALFGVHLIITTLFIDAVVAPLGTANVYTAATSRILYGLAKDFFPKSFLNKVNNFASPVYCLWVNAIVGACFLAPFPTWTELVDFLSSIVVFSYLAGPAALIILRQDFPNMDRPFKVFNYKLIGYAGFACCSLMIYWSNLSNLVYLGVLTAVLIAIYNIFIEKKDEGLAHAFGENFFIIVYLFSMVIVKYFREQDFISFPFDNIIVIAIACITCKIFVDHKISKKEIEGHIEKIKEENAARNGVL